MSAKINMDPALVEMVVLHVKRELARLVRQKITEVHASKASMRCKKQTIVFLDAMFQGINDIEVDVDSFESLCSSDEVLREDGKKHISASGSKKITARKKQIIAEAAKRLRHSNAAFLPQTSVPDMGGSVVKIRQKKTALVPASEKAIHEIAADSKQKAGR